MFSDALEGSGLRLIETKDFSLYSCRHTFVTNKILDGNQEHFIAALVNTSVGMIHKYYLDLTGERAAMEMDMGKLTKTEKYVLANLEALERRKHEPDIAHKPFPASPAIQALEARAKQRK